MPFIPLLALLLAAACAPAVVVTQEQAEGSWAASVTVQAAPVPLNPADPTQTVVGRLRYMGGLHLTSPDPRFGGLSGLRWWDGQLLAVSDEGDFFRMTLEERDDRLVGVRHVRMRRLTRPDGQPLSGKAESDAEALELEWSREGCSASVLCPSGAVVSFEGTNALWRYRLVDGLPEGAPAEVDQSTEWRRALPHNGGVEGMAAGWMVSEQLREPDGSASGRRTEWISIPAGRCFDCGPHVPRRWGPARARETPMNLPVSDGFAPTDADRPKASASIIVLQRRYSPGAGNAARIVRFHLVVEYMHPAPEITGAETLAELLPPLTLDNFEGLAAGAGSFIYIVSDNNFSPTQRTLLLKFEVIE
jgi:hypothetical protein